MMKIDSNYEDTFSYLGTCHDDAMISNNIIFGHGNIFIADSSTRIVDKNRSVPRFIGVICRCT